MGRKIIYCPYCASKIEVHIRTYSLEWLAYCEKCELLIRELTVVKSIEKALKGFRRAVRVRDGNEEELSLEQLLALLRKAPPAQTA